ncbi:MAG TPA: hypothetical protein DCW29_04305 [Janthinobacterium sp.]|nr:hypothetical protein [Janthinobacterium sp.]
MALGLNALGSSYASGAGNLITQFSTAAAGEVRVTYEYSVAAAVPEPDTYGMLLLGLGLVGCVARRKSLRRKV